MTAGNTTINPDLHLNRPHDTVLSIYVESCRGKVQGNKISFPVEAPNTAKGDSQAGAEPLKSGVTLLTTEPGGTQ